MLVSQGGGGKRAEADWDSLRGSSQLMFHALESAGCKNDSFCRSDFKKS